MFGKIFSIKHIEAQRIELLASFGGLLLKMKAQQALMEALSIDMS